MRVAIDITPLKGLHKGRGIGSYTKLLADALRQSKSAHSFYFFTRGERLPENVDLIHYTYFDPFFLTLPVNSIVPFVSTVHDLIPLTYPDKFPRGIRGELKWILQKKILNNARRLITDSKVSKNDIQKIMGFPPEKIDVVYLAPSPIFKPIKDAKLLFRVKQRYALPERFILYVGDVNWNKNIPGLLVAVKNVLQEFKNIKLILVGKAFLNNELEEVKIINSNIRDLGLENKVLKLGFVSEEELPAVYTLASVYVQPSFAEGFGFPILESMACGCPVVTSRASSLLEIAGPSILIDPYDSFDISQGIKKVFTMKDRTKLSGNSIAWSRQFTWNKVAQQTISSYEKALGN